MFFLTIFCTKIVVDFFGSWPPNHVNKNGVSRCFNQERCDKKTRFNNTWLGANWGSVVQKQEQLGCRHWHRTKKPFRDGSAQVFRAYPTWWSSDISSILQEPFVDHMASVHGNRKNPCRTASAFLRPKEAKKDVKGLQDRDEQAGWIRSSLDYSHKLSFWVLHLDLPGLVNVYITNWKITIFNG